MGFMKILGGAAIGVGAIAAAPFTGGGSLLGGAALLASLAGAGTVAAAVGAGVAGAGVAGLLSKKEQEDIDRANRESKEAGKVAAEKAFKEKLEEAEQVLNSWQSEFNELKDDLDNQKKFCSDIVALVGLGLSMSHADGEYSPEEKKEISDFMGGMASVLPSDVVAAIQKLEAEPPTRETAIQQALKIGVNPDLVDAILLAVAMADGEVTEEEDKFINLWNELKNVT